MKSNILLSVLIYFVCLLGACNADRDTPGKNASEWLIPASEVFPGGPGKDGIPSIDRPEFITAAQASYLRGDDLVVGFRVGNEARAYPHEILDWHEIVNDDFGGVKLAVIYCPLTGTATGWDRVIGNQGETTFGVSGLLYNTNIIPYDRRTDSNWSQMRLDCVEGELAGEQVALHNVVETTWQNWKNMYPGTRVLSRETGFSRNYEVYPYGDYLTSTRVLFPVASQDDRLHVKTRVHGVIVGDAVKAYSLSAFAGAEVGLVEDTIDGMPVVVAGSQSRNFIVSFDRRIGAELLRFTPVENGGAVIMKDESGSEWDIFGYALSGPRAGARLTPTRSYMGFWLGWAAFYPGLDLYE